MRKAFCCFILLGVFLLIAPEQSNCYEIGKGSKAIQSLNYRYELEAEYYSPLSEDHRIENSTLNLLFSTANDRGGGSYYHGVTVMRGWGSLEQHEVNQAYGIGPVLLRRYHPWQGENLSLAFDLSGCLVFYTEDFPLEGGFYNFMWRCGPRLTYQLDELSSWSIGYKLMHVSDGRSSNNASYNSQGITVSYSRTF